MKNKKARKIKIRIIAEGRKIWIPSIPFWLIRMGWRTARPFIRKAGMEPSVAAIAGLDISEILKELSGYGRFILADIDVADDKTKVFIEIL